MSAAWRWRGERGQPEDYTRILHCFLDKKDCCYSIHQMGEGGREGYYFSTHQMGEGQGGRVWEGEGEEKVKVTVVVVCLQPRWG